MQETLLNRRRFMQSASVAALGTATFPAVRPVSLLVSAKAASTQPQAHLAIVGAMGPASSVRVYQVLGKDWKLLQEIPSKAPISLLLHPNRETLYVLNQIDEHDGLPRGTVEAYRLDNSAAELKLLCRQSLSLSATRPRHMALSPDGATLAIAVAGGGSYNLLPVLADGQLGRVSSVRKETGRGPLAGHQDSSHPQALVFPPSGNWMIASDLGCDRLNVFSVANGIELTSRVQLTQGSGPRHLVLHPSLHPDGQLLFADHAFHGTISIFRVNDSGLIPMPDATTHETTHATTQFAFGDALVLDPSGEILYSAGSGSLSAWRVNRITGNIFPLRSIFVGPVHALAIAPGSSELFATTPHGVLQFEVMTANGLIGQPQSVTSVPDAQSIVIV